MTVRDVTDTLYLFEVLMTEARELDALIVELGSEGTTISMQRNEFIGDTEAEYTLMIRDYAANSTEENAQAIRRKFVRRATGKCVLQRQWPVSLDMRSVAKTRSWCRRSAHPLQCFGHP